MADVDPALAGLAFMVGKWEGEFETYPEAYGERAGRTPGGMEIVWGPGRAWMEVKARMDLPGSGSYVVGITIGLDPESGGYLAFAVNTQGTATLYTGELEGPGHAVFQGRPTKLQRVAYRALPEGGLQLSVEDSEDGTTWVRHSGATFRRAGPQ